MIFLFIVVFGMICVFSYFTLFHGNSNNREIITSLIKRTEAGKIEWKTQLDWGKEQEEYFGVDVEKNMHLHFSVNGGFLIHSFRHLHLYLRKEGYKAFGDKLGHVSITPVILLKKLEDAVIEQTGKRVRSQSSSTKEENENLNDFLKG